MAFVVRCGPCSGNGHYALDGRDTCKVCRGAGEITLEGTPEQYKACGPCAGNGHYGLVGSDICNICKGIGWNIRSLRLIARAATVDIWMLLHEEVARVARPRFESGHFADAVEAALKEVNDRTKRLTKKATGDEYDGADLMHRTFSVKQPVLVLGDLSTVFGRDMQQGYMEIFAGAMIGIRNPKAHSNITIDRARAIHFLVLASLLMFKIDEALSTERNTPAGAAGM
jgi:uncharacterized protein (TIGR02391 family)